MAAPAVPVIPAPMQLAGLGARLKRSKLLETRAGTVGVRIDNALDVIETGTAALENHAPQLEQYGGNLMATINSLLERSNGSDEETKVDPAAEAPPLPDPPLGPNGGPRIL